MAYDPERIAEDLAAIVGGDALLREEPMSAHTTFKIGGPAEFFVRPQTPEQVATVAALCHEQDVPCYVLGLGSNVLVSDDGLRGVVIQIADNMAAIEVDSPFIRVQAGASNKDVARAAREAELTGYEFASGIPGSIGGAAIMNAGAYDGEFKDVAREVTCLTPEGELVVLGVDEAAWAYRHSFMMDAGYIVLSALLELHAGEGAAIEGKMDDLENQRASKQPLEYPSAGSTFKRPEGHFVGPMIQECGLQGFAIGGAQISTKHAGFVVNKGGATAQDVLDLIAHVQEVVRERFDVDLVPEVRMWGF